MLTHHTLFLLFLVSTLVAIEPPRVRLVEGQTGDEGILQLYMDTQWITVCSGDENLADAACRWHGYISGSSAEYSRPAVKALTDNMFQLQVNCSEDPATLADCSTNTCSSTKTFYVRCSGYPDCRMEDGTVVPGNSTAFVGRDKVCYCSRNNAVTCDCRNVVVKCSNGSPATLDDNCDPTCSGEEGTSCKDTQGASLCNYYQTNGQCSNKSVGEMCRETCGLCGGDPAPALKATCKDVQGASLCNYYKTNGQCENKNVGEMCRDTCGRCGEPESAPVAAADCVDQYDEQICLTWQGIGGCERENVREVCEKTCGVCQTSAAKSEEPSEPTPCEDYYNAESCRLWQEAGHCATSETVRKWCESTCQLCDSNQCRDTLSPERCAISFKQGSCGKNMKILKGCAETCGLCEPLTQTNCRNIYKPDTCKIWASQGVCGTNKEVQKYCAESCGVCERLGTPSSSSQEKEEEEGCSDNSTQSLCNYYNSAGYCGNKDYAEAMRAQCKSTCGLCENALCKDVISSGTCERWQRGGHCDTNTPVREEMCKQTCNFC